MPKSVAPDIGRRNQNAETLATNFARTVPNAARVVFRRYINWLDRKAVKAFRFSLCCFARQISILPISCASIALGSNIGIKLIGIEFLPVEESVRSQDQPSTLRPDRHGFAEVALYLAARPRHWHAHAG